MQPLTGIFSLRGVLVFLVACLVSIRGLVPVGYMIDASPDDGSIVIRMCGGLDEHYVRFNPETGEIRKMDAPAGETPVQPDEERQGSACPYALSAVADLPQPMPGEVLMGLYGPPLLSDRPVLVPVRSFKPSPVLPRGPPQSV